MEVVPVNRPPAAWSDARMQACRSGEELGHRATCLDRIHAEVVPLVDAMVEADEQTIALAVESLDELPSLGVCSNEEAALLGLAAVPEGREDELARHRKALAEAKVSMSTGHYREADAALVQLEREADGFDYPPFTAELAVARARLGLLQLEPNEAFSRMHVAATLAEKARHDRLAAYAWTNLAYSSADQLSGPHENATQWLERAEVASARLGEPPDIEARLHCIRGVLLGQRAELEQGIELLAQLPEEEPQWLGIGDVTSRTWRPRCLSDLAELHEGAKAIELAEQALAAAESVYGPDHPNVAHYAFALAGLLLASEDGAVTPKAKLLLEQAAAIWLAKFDDSNSEVADAHVSLATIAIEEGRFDVARTHVARARQVYSHVLAPDDHQHAQPILLEAAIAAREGDHAAALAFYDQARSFLTTPGLEGPLAEVDRERAECQRALDDLHE